MKVSLKSDSEVAFNEFPDNEELSLRQNPIETEVREQITDGQTVTSDQPASHGSVPQQLKHENESRESNSDAEECAARGKTLKVQNLTIS